MLYGLPFTREWCKNQSLHFCVNGQKHYFLKMDALAHVDCSSGSYIHTVKLWPDNGNCRVFNVLGLRVKGDCF